MVKNTVYTDHYFFRNYDITHFVMHVNGKLRPSEGLSLAMNLEKNSVMVNSTLVEGSGIHHSNSGLQVTHDMYIVE